MYYVIGVLSEDEVWNVIICTKCQKYAANLTFGYSAYK